MTYKVRRATFETNSSSCHSLTIDEGGTDFTSITPDADGIIRVEPGEFGWGVETHRDPKVKLAYLMQYIIDWVRPGEYTEARNPSTEFPPVDADANRFWVMLNLVVCEHTGATGIELVSCESCHPYGYIDHQSVEGRALDYVFTPSSLKAFVFGKNSVLETDNDNH